MKSLVEILEKLKLDISTDLPALLTIAGLSDFAVYHIGSSKDPQELGFFIYQNEIKKDSEMNLISVIFNLQLYQIDEIDAAKYSDVITDYMKVYDPYNLGMDTLEEMTSEYWPVETNSTSFVFVVLNWKEEIDSCS